MLDIKDIKNRKQYYADCFKKREYEVDLDKLIGLYDNMIAIKKEQELLLAKKNKGAKEFDAIRRNGGDIEKLQIELRQNTQRVAELTEQYNKIQEEYSKIFFALPNIVVDDTPRWRKRKQCYFKRI